MSSVTVPRLQPFVFLDRDGTIVKERHYLCDPDQVVLCAGAAEGLRRLQSAGHRLVVVTNQSGIARGYFTEAQFHAVNRRMQELLSQHHVSLDAIYWCPHGPDANCDCRKPRPGMVQGALRDLGGILGGAVVIGDKECDLQLAHNLDLPAILVRTGYGRETETALTAPPTFVADDLAAAADFLLNSANE